MATYKFIKIADKTNSHDLSNIKFVIKDVVNLDSVVDEFVYFLKACSFSKDLKLEIAYEGEDVDSDDK